MNLSGKKYERMENQQTKKKVMFIIPSMKQVNRKINIDKRIKGKKKNTQKKHRKRWREDCCRF